MSRHQYLYSRWPIELPTIILVSLWLGLWLAWPRATTSSANTRPVTQTRIRFVELAGGSAPSRVELLGFLFQPRARDVIADDPEPIIAAPTLMAHPHVLAYRKAVLEPAPDVPEEPALMREAAAGLRGYRPVWPRVDPFGKGPPFVLRVELLPARDLVACGYTVPDAALEGLNDGDKPWEFTYYVVCGVDGRTRDVFALAEPVTSSLQSNLVSALNQGHVRPGRACEGRITVRRVHKPESTASPAPTGREQT